MPVLSIDQTIAAAHRDDLLIVLGNQPMPPLTEKGMVRLVYLGDNPDRQAAFRRLQMVPGVVAEY